MLYTARVSKLQKLNGKKKINKNCVLQQIYQGKQGYKSNCVMINIISTFTSFAITQCT